MGSWAEWKWNNFPLVISLVALLRLDFNSETAGFSESKTFDRKPNSASIWSSSPPQNTQLCNQTLVKLDFPSSSLWIFNWKERKGSLCSRWNFSKSGQNSISSNSNSADCKLGIQKRWKGNLLKTRSHPFFRSRRKWNLSPLIRSS